MAAGSGTGQDGSMLHAQFQEVVDRWNSNVSGPFSDILAVLLCMCFVPLIPIWLITADSEGWTVQLTLTPMALTCRNTLLISVVTINHVVSYDRQIVGTNCQIPNHTKSLEYTWPLTEYSSDWGGFRAERQNFSPFPNFFETGHLWIYCICSFNKLLADIPLGVYFPAVILYHKYLRQEL